MMIRQSVRGMFVIGWVCMLPRWCPLHWFQACSRCGGVVIVMHKLMYCNGNGKAGCVWKSIDVEVYVLVPFSLRRVSDQINKMPCRFH